MDYYIISILVAATVTIVPKVLPFIFFERKTFNKKLMNFFHIVPLYVYDCFNYKIYSLYSRKIYVISDCISGNYFGNSCVYNRK